MSRNTVILLVVLCAGVAGLIVFSKMRSAQQSPGVQQTARDAVASPAPANSERPNNAPVVSGRATQPAPAPAPTITMISTGAPQMTTLPRAVPGGTSLPALAHVPGTTTQIENPVPDLKPLPVLEKEYATATNRDVRLDLMMDIAETPGPESIKTLTRLFEAETDTDLKVDLLDSLLGIEGFKEEKLIMLTMGARQGLPVEVRQSAIDGLIDLDDQRVIPVLNGLLNDPDPEIREGAKDALEMLQTPTQVIAK